MIPDPPQVSWVIPFLAGVVSFLSPCVIPLIPGYVSHISGGSADDLEAGAPGRTGRILGQSLCLCLDSHWSLWHWVPRLQRLALR